MNMIVHRIIVNLIIVVIGAIIYSFFFNFSTISYIILAAIIIFIIIRTIIEQKKLQEKILMGYLEYCESMEGKDTVKSYEEFKQSYDNILKKEARKEFEEYQKKRVEAERKQSHRKRNKFAVYSVKAYLEHCELMKVEDNIKSYEEYIKRTHEEGFTKSYKQRTYEEALIIHNANTTIALISYSEYQNIVEENLLREYREYCESMKGKDTVKSYEEFNKEKYEEAKNLANIERLSPPKGRSVMVCPHCQTRGTVTTKKVKMKKGVSGAKATGAVLSLGWSLLVTGLSRKEEGIEAHCAACGATWHFF